jgi:hypothetical protein
VAARKQEQMEKLRKALGIKEDIKWGEAFDPEAQARRKEEQKQVRGVHRLQEVPRCGTSIGACGHV